MLQITIPTVLILLAQTASGLLAQTPQVFQVSKNHDASDAPSTYPFPGMNGAFRQQTLISSQRLVGLQGAIRGLWIRRDMVGQGALQGGLVDLEIRIAKAPHAPNKARSDFTGNLATTPTLVFQGRVTVPNSPRPGSNPALWGPLNSIQVPFTTPFPYTGGPLCIDVAGRPVAGSEPEFWFVDNEYDNNNGVARPIGTSCSPFADTAGQTHFADDLRLQIGSTLRLIALGRPGSSPLLLLGPSAIPAGVDLTPMGAPGCRQYVDFFSITRLAYGKAPLPGQPVALHFDTQIPADPRLLGVSVFTQFADDENALTQRSNPAGLTTSNALELRVSSVAPDLGLAIVTSRVVAANAAMPAVGEVNVSMGPVLRLLYR